MKIILAEEIVQKLTGNIHLLYTPLKIAIHIACPDKSYEKWIYPELQNSNSNQDGKQTPYITSS